VDEIAATIMLQEYMGSGSI